MSSTINKKNKSRNIDNILVFVVSLILFLAIINSISTDIPAHLQSIVRVNAGNASYAPHFLFFFAVNFLSFFSSNISLMLFVTAVILSLATLGKFVVSKEVISELTFSSNHEHKRMVIKIVSFMLLFCFAIPDVYNFFIVKKMYLGRTPSVVWHNSTTISVFPFAILLFWRQLKLFDNVYTSFFNRDVLIVSVLVCLNIFIKPSFIFVFIPITVFIILKDFEKTNLKDYLIKLFPVFLGVTLLGIQYISIYYYQIGSFQAEKSSIAITMPFEFFRRFIPGWYIPISFAFSFAFPLIVIAYYRDILKFRPFVYALYLTLLGIFISAIFNEAGPRRFHGNLVWQNIICAYLLFLTTTSFILPKFFNTKRYSKEMIIVGFVFVLHFLSGLLYLFKIYFTGSYH